MLKSMTIGKKIILGFSVVLILLVAVWLVAYEALDTGSKGFDRYRQIARNTNLVGRVQANMLMVQTSAKDFILSGSDEDLKKIENYTEKVNGFLAEAKEQIKNKERAEHVREAEAALTQYRAAFEQVKESQKQSRNMLTDTLNVKGAFLESKLTEIMKASEKQANTAVAFNAGMALRNLMLGRLYVVKFINANDPADADHAKAEFTETEQKIKILDSELQDPELKKTLSLFQGAEKEYRTTFDSMVDVIFKRNDIIKGTLNRIEPEIDRITEDVKLTYMAEQDKLGPKLVSANARSMSVMTFIGIGALVIGALFAFLITRGLTKSLGMVSEGLKGGADQVAAASGQVSAASQSLAEGASEQAASLEETSSSLEEMSSMTKQNAENAGAADKLMKETEKVVATANKSMSQLTSSMEEITAASDETGKIIKTIDEIAFQTNLLALNAAVEAAEPGKPGPGSRWWPTK